MRILNLSGIKVGERLDISVSQGAITAGPVNVPSWGGTGGDGGTISIVVERGHMEVAPESVRFSVDLSQANFDTQGPGPGEAYDPRLHDLIYLWDMKDTAPDWSKPVNVLAAWRDRSVAKGPFVQHMYTQVGTYSPSVLVIEPSSGKMASTVVPTPITVGNPNAAYPGTNTICVSTSGDFTGAPAGAATLTTDELLSSGGAWTSRNGGGAKRWLFRRGEEFKVKLRIGSAVTNGLYFGAYGTGDRPNLIWNGVASTDAREMNRFSLEGYGANTPDIAPDIRFVGLAFKEGFDPTTTRSDYRLFDSAHTQQVTEPPIRSLANCCGMISDCEFDGIQVTNINMQGGDTSEEQSWHIDDCSMTRFGGQYPIFGVGSTHERSSLSVTGCLLAQNEGTMGVGLAEAQGSSRAILRSTNPHRFHMRGNDSFHTDMNQHHYVPFKGALEPGGVVNVHSCVMEGGNGAMTLLSSPSLQPRPYTSNSICVNAIVDGCFYFCGPSSQTPFFANGSGITLRNIHVVQPAIDRVLTNNRALLEVHAKGTFDETLVGNAPIKVYNCTYVYMKTDAQAVGAKEDPQVLVYSQESGAAFNVLIEENNIFHKPNAGPTFTNVTTFAPLTENVLFTPRYKGHWNTDPEFASEKNSKRTLANGASYTIPYGMIYGYYRAATQADFAGSRGQERMYLKGSSNKEYYAADGDFTVDYGSTEITITNISGEDWDAAGAHWWLLLDMGSTAPIVSTTVPAVDSWKDYRPAPGSAGLGAALNGEVSYMDITLQDRPEPPSMGAWEAE